jgi:hypothetical protein
MALAGSGRQQTATHQIARCSVEPSQDVIFEELGRPPGIKPIDPKRLAFVDVADAGADPLVEQEFADGLRV